MVSTSAAQVSIALFVIKTQKYRSFFWNLDFWKILVRRAPRGDDREYERDAQEEPGGPGGKNASRHVESVKRCALFRAGMFTLGVPEQSALKRVQRVRYNPARRASSGGRNYFVRMISLPGLPAIEPL
jgi:hypothetical protein